MARIAEPEVRWIIRRDHDEVLEIDALAFRDNWDSKKLLATLKINSVVGVVAEDSRGEILGFCLYQFSGPAIKLLRLAVARTRRRNGVGRYIIDRIKCKLENTNRDSITVTVDESELGAQLFFSSCGFVGSPCGNQIQFTFTEG